MDYTLTSGAKLSVTPAPFADAMALQRSLLGATQAVKIPADMKDFKALDANFIKDAVVGALTSDAVDRALWACARRSQYNTFPVEPSLFDDPKVGGQARQDFYEMAWLIIKDNCAPFFKTTFSRFGGALARATVPPAS